jgi:hypothetical protein
VECAQREIVAANPDEWKAEGLEAVPQSKAEEVEKAIRARAYVECDAKAQINTGAMFETAIRVIVHPDEYPQEHDEQAVSTEGGCCEVF